MLPDKITQLAVSIGAAQAGQLIKRAGYEFRYLDPRSDQAAVALLMPASVRATWQDGDLFPVMDQNLPEGDLFLRLRALFPNRHPGELHSSDAPALRAVIQAKAGIHADHERFGPNPFVHRGKIAVFVGPRLSPG